MAGPRHSTNDEFNYSSGMEGNLKSKGATSSIKRRNNLSGDDFMNRKRTNDYRPSSNQHTRSKIDILIRLVYIPPGMFCEYVAE